MSYQQMLYKQIVQQRADRAYSRAHGASPRRVKEPRPIPRETIDAQYYCGDIDDSPEGLDMLALGASGGADGGRGDGADPADRFNFRGL